MSGPTGTRSGIEGHGLSPREQAIMDLHEAKVAIGDIAAELGLAPTYVRQVTTMYSGSWAGNDAFDAMVRMGTIALAARIDAVGGRWA